MTDSDMKVDITWGDGVRETATITHFVIRVGEKWPSGKPKRPGLIWHTSLTDKQMMKMAEQAEKDGLESLTIWEVGRNGLLSIAFSWSRDGVAA